MAAPDPTAVRRYVGRMKWLRNAALRDVKSLAQDVETLKDGIERGDRLFACDARNLASSAAALVERLAKLEALDEVSYLTTDPDAEEATPNG